MLRKLIWLEVKALVRRSPWLLVVAITALFFFFLPFAPHLSIEAQLPLAGEPHWPLYSLGEWGRAILLTMETFASGFFVIFIALLAVSSLFPELVLREPLWATPGASRVRTALAKLLAVSSVATFLVIIGASAVFFHSSVRESLVLVGWRYIPIYFVFVWIRISLWVALAMFFLHLTRSRAATIAIVVMLQVVWFIAGLPVMPGSFLRLLHRSLLAWNFVSPLAPLGLIPTVFFLQALTKVGLVVVLIVAALQLRRGSPLRLPAVKGALVLGLVLVVGAGGSLIWEMQERTAPFRVRDLWHGQVTFARPYIWSKDGRVLVYPGEFTAVRLPLGAPLPAWVEKLAERKELHRYDVGEMSLETWEEAKALPLWKSRATERDAPQSLILIHPSGQPYPPEVAEVMLRFRHEVQPLFNRARLWHKEAKIVFAWPEEAIFGINLIPGGILVSLASLSPGVGRGRAVATALAEASGLEGPVQVYLGLYLLTALDPKGVDMARAALRDIAEGTEIHDITHRPGAWALIGVGWEWTFRTEEAVRILHHWQQGEEMGHENYIRRLLEERN